MLTNVDAIDRSMLFWRQFSHWLGGMGIIILAVAVLPRLRIGGRQLLQSELAGPTEIERFSETCARLRDACGPSTSASRSSPSWPSRPADGLGLDPAMTLFDAVG